MTDPSASRLAKNQRDRCKGKVLSRVLIALGILLLVAFLAAIAWLFLPAWIDPLRLPRDQWREFTLRYVTPEGRVVDTGNGNISHSEGQGYGMLFAVQFNDRRTFQKIWDWTQRNLQIRPDKLFAWRWEPNQAGGGGVTDLNNASDAEVLIAWALLQASQRWNRSDFAQSAAQILSDLRSTCFHESELGLVLLPAQKGFVRDEDILILNPSYFIFPALRDLSEFTLREEMQALGNVGMDLCKNGTFGPTGLVADWVVVDGKTISLAGEYEFSENFGYDAIRVPLQIAWVRPNSPLLRPYADFWRGLPEDRPLPATVALPGGEPGDIPALPGMQAAADFVIACAGGRVPLPREIPRILPDEAYYSAALKMLTMIAASEAPRKDSD